MTVETQSRLSLLIKSALLHCKRKGHRMLADWDDPRNGEHSRTFVCAHCGYKALVRDDAYPLNTSALGNAMLRNCPGK